MPRRGFFIFQAETIDIMRRTFEEVCDAIQLTKGEAPRALAAERIFQLAKGGERDAARLASRVIEQFPVSDCWTRARRRGGGYAQRPSSHIRRAVVDSVRIMVNDSDLRPIDGEGSATVLPRERSSIFVEWWRSNLERALRPQWRSPAGDELREA
jgi:hypothetical protein